MLERKKKKRKKRQTDFNLLTDEEKIDIFGINDLLTINIFFWNFENQRLYLKFLELNQI